MILNEKDKELIDIASQIVKNNCDIYESPDMHVGAALRAKSGKIYTGLNVRTSHSICAEQVALSNALAGGEREFDTLVAVKLDTNGNIKVVSPCGLCRYIYDKLGYNPTVIVEDIKNGDILKVKAFDLLPYPYKR